MAVITHLIDTPKEKVENICFTGKGKALGKSCYDSAIDDSVFVRHGRLFRGNTFLKSVSFSYLT